MQPDVQVRGKLARSGAPVDATEAQPEYGTVDVALCGYGSQVPKIMGEAHIALLEFSDAMNPATDPAPGTFWFSLYSNDVIQPAGTYYTFTMRDANGDIAQTQAYRFEAGDFDLSELAPYDPTQAPGQLPPWIRSQLEVRTASENPGGTVFDGSNYMSFQYNLDMNGYIDISGAYAGNLYTVIFEQDSVGGWEMEWRDNFFNPPSINPTPHGITVQTFVAVPSTDPDFLNFYPIAAPTWFVP